MNVPRVGWELQPESPHLTPREREALLTFKATGWRPCVKIRFADAGLIRELHALLGDDLWIYTRPTSEGYTWAEMVAGYEMFESVFLATGLIRLWKGHEIANEPNMVNERGEGPYAGEWGGSQFAPKMRMALDSLLPIAKVPLISPGLQPYQHTAQWWDTCGDEFLRCGRTGSHAYWNTSDWNTGVFEAIRHHLGGRYIITEIGDSSHDLNNIKTLRIIGAIEWLARNANCEAIINFILDSSNPTWRDDFVLPLDCQIQIATCLKNLESEQPTMSNINSYIEWVRAGGDGTLAGYLDHRTNPVIGDSAAKARMDIEAALGIALKPTPPNIQTALNHLDAARTALLPN